MDENQSARTPAAAWLGFTFDVPASNATRTPALRGVCVAVTASGNLVLRQPDGSHGVALPCESKIDATTARVVWDQS